MRIYLILFALLIIAVLPATAQTETWTAPSTEALSSIEIVSNPETTGTITFTFLDGSTKTGSWSYEYLPNIVEYPYDYMSSISIEGDSEDREFITPGNLHTIYEHLGGVGTFNLTQNRIVGYSSQSSTVWDIWPLVETSTPASPIVGFTIVADSQVTYEVLTVDRTGMSGLLASGSEDWINKIMSLATGTFWSAYGMISDLVYWLRYFFVDNLGMIVALFLAVPMAFAAKNSKGNPEKFLRQYFKTLKGFFDFVLYLWRMLLESIGTVRGWFRI